MNTKENAPKDTKQSKKSIEAISPEKSKNSSSNKNYQSKNDQSTETFS